MSARRPAARGGDPVATYLELREAALQGRLPRLTLLLPPLQGEEEPWFAGQILAAAREQARGRSDLDLLDLDGGSPDFQPEALEAFLGAASLFASARALLWERAGKALARAPRLAAALLQAARAGAGPAWMVVQVDAPGTKVWNEALKQAGAAKPDGGPVEGLRVERFRRLYGDAPPWNPADLDASEAARFAAGEARLRGLRLERGAAGTLVQVAGARPAELSQALEHFALLRGAGEAPIGEEDVRRVAAHGAEGNAFEFADAVLRGDAAAALRCLQRLRARGLHSWDGRRLGAQEAFAMLSSVLAKERQKSAAAAREMARGASVEEACAAAGAAAKGTAFERMKRRLQHPGAAAHFARLLGALRAAERQVKAEGRRDTLHPLEELAWKSLRAPRR